MTAQRRRIVILAAEFNAELVEGMIEEAKKELTAAAAELVRLVRVPGAYELPLLADVYLAREGVDALVVLGHIERGETLHGEVMGHVVHAALVQLQLKHHKPVGMGIIGPGATAEQARQRQTSSARAAARAALRGCELLTEARG
jgi:6,7-dimethyl-8-ribityllumazine synthase